MKRSNRITKEIKKNLYRIFTGLLVSGIFFMGCISVGLVKGEYFLSGGQYQKGESIFREEIREKPQNGESWYYLGRFMLAQEKYKDAVPVLEKAVALNPDEAGYHFWLGLSYGAVGKIKSEISSYKKAIALDPDYGQAYTYLGHSYFRQKKYPIALENYAHALRLSENNPSAIYNQALIYYRTKLYEKSKKGFKKYLADYGYSPKAIRAVNYLNRMGDFDFRVHLINKKQVIFEKLTFTPDKNGLAKNSRESLAYIADIMAPKSKLELYVLSYEKNNMGLAKSKASQIKSYLENYSPNLKNGKVKIGFFGEPEKIRIGKKNVKLDSSINFFVVPENVIK